MKPTPKGSLLNSLSSDRSKVKVTKRSKTYFGQNMLSFCPIHMKPAPKGSLFNSLSSDRLKVKVTKRSKTYFGHNTLSFRPIHKRSTPKFSLFNSLSSDMAANVALAKVCALPSAHSSLSLYGGDVFIICDQNVIYLLYFQDLFIFLL